MSTKTTHTPGALRAATQWIEPLPGNRLHRESVTELASLIDRETAVPELVAALEESERVIRWAAQESSRRVKREIVDGWLYHAKQARALLARIGKAAP